MCPCLRPHAPSTARAGSSPQHNFVCPAPARQHAAEVQSSSAGHKFCPAARAPKGSWPHSPRPIGMDPPAPTPARPTVSRAGSPQELCGFGVQQGAGGLLGPPPLAVSPAGAVLSHTGCKRPNAACSTQSHPGRLGWAKPGSVLLPLASPPLFSLFPLCFCERCSRGSLRFLVVSCVFPAGKRGRWERPCWQRLAPSTQPPRPAQERLGLLSSGLL